MKEEVIVLYPSPEIGHLVSMVELAKQLLLHHHHHQHTTTTTNYFSIIILLTASPNNATAAATSYIQQISLTNPSITFRHFPPLASSTSTSTTTAPRSGAAILFEFVRLNATNVLHALRDISITCIIRALVIDLFCTSALPIARDLRIPVYYFFTSGAAVLGCFLYLPTVHKQTKKSFKDLNTTYLHFPGLPPIPAPHVPEPLLDRDDPAYADFIHFCENLPNSDGIIVNTFDDLEPDSLKTIATGVCLPLPDAIIPPVYYIGPLIATREVVCVDEARDSLMSWLDSQPGQSVVYLCFGSRGSFSAAQLKEIANGLERSGQRFLWVVKSKSPQDVLLLLPDGFLARTKERGVVATSWVPQVEVLRHESVGGFVTHCGWNSVLEAVVAGVPMVAWPLYAEQHVNKAILVENMKMAIPLEKREGDNGLVSAAELAKRVTELMDLEVGRELRERSRKMREMALAAWGDTGSSTTALAELIGLWKHSECFHNRSQYIAGQREKFVRLDELDSSLSLPSDTGGLKNFGLNLKGLTHPDRSNDNPSKSFRRGMKKRSEGVKTFGRSLRSGVTRAVFPEDLKVSEKKIFDPQDKSLQFWNRLFVVSCILAVGVDPLFFYLPIFEYESSCLTIDEKLAKTTTTLRTLIDVFYLLRMALQFRTAYIAPSSRVFGRGELVIDPAQIAARYLRRYFIVDFLAVLPLPQIVVWKFVINPQDSKVLATKQALLIIVCLQYIPRFVRFIPLTSEVKKSAGVFAESAWAGATYYLIWYMLSSHIVGAFWYLLAVERHDTCWRNICYPEKKCHMDFLYCANKHTQGYGDWINISSGILGPKCSNEDEGDSKFNYGIYGDAITSKIVTNSTEFSPKLCYCLWWGLKNLSTLGQGLQTSTYPGEILFSIALAIFGLILFALLIGNMQTYLQSLTIRLEEMRIKRRDSEQWMHHRLLPQDLRERVRRYDQYKWLETRGVDEESLVQSLPKDLRRDIKRHLCLNLVKRVPLFENMDERLLVAICERLKPSLYTENTFIVREGDPVDEMLFIIRGRLESVTTDGGRSGFFNRGLLKEGDFCGEELLTWALDPKAASNLPSSTRTVMALTEVEAFALIAEELKFVASQFRRLHSRQVQHTFRFYSQQWRTWAAIFIQAAWRRYSRRKILELRRIEEEEEEEKEKEEQKGEEERALIRQSDSLGGSSSTFGTTILASRFAANALRGVHRLRSSKSSTGLLKLQKPSEPDFSTED